MIYAYNIGMNMKVAIPIWDGRISPLMDTACYLLIADIEQGQVVSKETIGIPRMNIPDQVSFLTDRNIDVLICGAISHQLERILAGSGVKPIPWFRGNVDEIIAAYAGGTLQNDNYRLPGCGRRRRRERSQRCGRGMGFGARRQFKEE